MAASAQVRAVTALGGIGLAATGSINPAALTALAPLSGVLWWGAAAVGQAIAVALAARTGPIIPMITGLPDAAHVLHERHVCIDTTAAGGNATLLAEVGAAQVG